MDPKSNSRWLTPMVQGNEGLLEWRDPHSNSNRSTPVFRANEGLLEWMDPYSNSRCPNPWSKRMRDWCNGWILTLILFGTHPCQKGMRVLEWKDLHTNSRLADTRVRREWGTTGMEGLKPQRLKPKHGVENNNNPTVQTAQVQMWWPCQNTAHQPKNLNRTM